MTTHSVRHGIPADILALSHERDQLRKRGHYDRADALKKLIEDAGYSIKDNPRGAHLVILPSIEVDGTLYRTARQVPSLLNESDTCLFSVQILANNCAEQVRRCVESMLRHAGARAVEVLLIDNASQDESQRLGQRVSTRGFPLHILRISRVMGEAEARNLGLQQSRGSYILQLDPSIELTGDIFAPLTQLLEKRRSASPGCTVCVRTICVTSRESLDEEVEAISGSCMAFRRKLLKKVGLFDEGYRFPAYMDIDFNFAVRESGVQAIVAPRPAHYPSSLPIQYLPFRRGMHTTDQAQLLSLPGKMGRPRRSATGGL